MRSFSISSIGKLHCSRLFRKHRHQPSVWASNQPLFRRSVRSDAAVCRSWFRFGPLGRDLARRRTSRRGARTRLAGSSGPVSGQSGLDKAFQLSHGIRLACNRRRRNDADPDCREKSGAVIARIQSGPRRPHRYLRLVSDGVRMHEGHCLINRQAMFVVFWQHRR